MLQQSLNSYASFGITTVQDGRTSPKDWKLLQKAASEGALYLDVIAYPAIEMMTKEWQPDFQRFSRYQSGLKLGGVKLSLDGSMPGKTAYLSEPYFIVPEGRDKDYRGYTAFSDEQVNAFVKRAWDNSWQILIHTNADAAGDQMLNAVKALGDISGKDWRPVMIHGQAAREDQLDDMKALDMLVSFEMTHPFIFGDYYVESVFGQERGERNNPAGSALKRGLNYTFHNDSPVVVPDVLMTAWVGVNRLTRSNKVIGPEQRVSAYEALKALTVYAAYQNFEEDSKGSLEAGKVADLVILDKNPLKVPAGEIKDVEVVETIKAGEVVWPRP